MENSIVHGMRSRSAGGRIRIVPQRTADGCRIQITDNGGGFSRSRMEENTAEGHRSIGLQNIAGRIALSGGKIFFAAIVPGLVLSLFCMIYVFIICHIHPDYGPAMTTEELAAMPLRERVTGSLVNLIPPVILIVGVLGSIFTGWATPTEAAGVGALFSLILAIFYKQFSWKMLYDSLIDTAKTSAMVFIILFGASAFTGIFMSLDGDQLIATWIASVGIGKWGAFAIMMAIVFVMGMFLDWLGIVMIVFPIFLPNLVAS